MIIRSVKIESNGNHSFMFGQGKSTYKTLDKEIEQDILCRLYSFKNDCFFALDDCIDWLQHMGYKNQKEALDNEIVETIQDTDGVLDVVDFESALIDRNYSFNATVRTIYSENLQINFSKEVE